MLCSCSASDFTDRLLTCTPLRLRRSRRSSAARPQCLYPLETLEVDDFCMAVDDARVAQQQQAAAASAASAPLTQQLQSISEMLMNSPAGSPALEPVRRSSSGDAALSPSAIAASPLVRPAHGASADEFNLSLSGSPASDREVASLSLLQGDGTAAEARPAGAAGTLLSLLRTDRDPAPSPLRS